MQKEKLLATAVFVCAFFAEGLAQQQENISAHLARIEESIKGTNQQLAALEKRLEDLNISLGDPPTSRISPTSENVRIGVAPFRINSALPALCSR